MREDSNFALRFNFRRLREGRGTFVIFVESFGERKGWSPWLRYLDSGLNFLQTLNVLLIGEHLRELNVYFHLLRYHLIWL